MGAHSVTARPGKEDSTRKIQPDMKTAPSAAFQPNPNPPAAVAPHTLIAKNTLWPMAGASAMGYLASKPIRIVAIALAMHVAANTPFQQACASGFLKPPGWACRMGLNLTDPVSHASISPVPAACWKRRWPA